MKTKIMIIFSLIPMFLCCLPTKLNAYETSLSNTSNSVNKEETIASFDINNPTKQEQNIVTDTGKLIKITLLEENLTLMPLSVTNETWGVGTHIRRIEVSDDITTMSVMLNMSSNSYTTTIHSISDGRYRSLTGIFIRERYIISEKTSVAPNHSTAKYEVDYSLPVGTHTMCLYVYVYANGDVNAFIKGIW